MIQTFLFVRLDEEVVCGRTLVTLRVVFLLVFEFLHGVKLIFFAHLLHFYLFITSTQQLQLATT